MARSKTRIPTEPGTRHVLDQGPAAEQPSGDKPVLTPERELAKRYLDEIGAAQAKQRDWHLRGDAIIRRYKDDRDQQTQNSSQWVTRRMNVLWANVETLKPAMYAKTPKPNVSRMHKDQAPIGRWASIVLERCLGYELNSEDFDHTLRQCVADLLLPGRAVAWEVYDPTIKGEGEAAKVEWERSYTSYVNWKDFVTNQARNWEEVWFVAKRDYLTRSELVEKFGDKAANVTLDHAPEEPKVPEGQTQARKATVWTIWDKSRRKVCMVAPGCETGPLLDTDPPCNFDAFFPCPRPMFATLGSDSIVPVPDYALYQDQAEEIDLLTNRINAMIKALRVRGVYDASVGALNRLMQDGQDNDLFPVENWGLLSEKGGVAGVIQWIPLRDIAAALQIAYEARDKAKEAMYEVTGISDIVRGSTDASETATAQQIKSQWGSLRIRDRQTEVQRFARDLIRLKAEVICAHFGDETIKAMSGVKLLTGQQKQALAAWKATMQQGAQMAQAMAQAGQQPPPPPPPPVSKDLMQAEAEPTWDEVIGLLRSEKMRGFSIDIEADSTIEPDQRAEQENRVAFVGAIAQYMGAALPMLQAMPKAAPLVGELLMFAVRGWKVGETIETQIEQAMAQIAQMEPVPPPGAKPGVDPKAAAMEGELKSAELQLKAREGAAKIGIEEKKLAAEQQRVMTENSVEQGWQQLDSARLAFEMSQPPKPVGTRQ